ncbi:MAG: DUF5906 domain-containing protein [Herminiimonas sp.]|uniref:primase-helicase family protein n=1 Tax=Herminiimonas sp. TaxID=1926289 RepID=UPI002715927F|nr:primase-helicase family protein [Herminiimonas sp.]MDO9419962.1 DUF5906 domain-containing protein [Herminiimonas sp.]
MTTTKTTELSAKEATKRYAKHLENESYCHDYSKISVMALKSKGNQEVNPQFFVDCFPKWASTEGIKVAQSEYPEFIEKLPNELRKRLPQIFGSAMKPTIEKFFVNSAGVKLSNTFIPFTPDFVSIPPPILGEYFQRVCMNENDRKFVPMFLADIIQNPCIRPQSALVVTGAPGTGKSSLYRLVELALGHNHTYSKNSYTDAFKPFSEVFCNNLLAAFDDCDANDRNAYMKLKDGITRKSMSVEIKGQQNLVSRDVYCRIMIFSNLPEAGLVIEEGDRRLYCTERSDHLVNEAESKEFFTRFVKFLEHPDTPAILYHYFLSIDLTDFKRGEHVSTPTHKAMIENSTSVLYQSIKEYTDEKPIFVEGMLNDSLISSGVKFPNPDKVKAALSALGYERKRRVVEGCNPSKIYVLQPRSIQKARALTDKEALAIAKHISSDF